MLNRAETTDLCADGECEPGPADGVRVVRGHASVMAALEDLSTFAAITPFQSNHWLRCIYHHLARARNAEPCLVILNSVGDHAGKLLLPLVVIEERGLRVAGFPDFGLSDYGAPRMTSVGLEDFSDTLQVSLVRLITRALSDIDRLSLTNMPIRFDEVRNPLAVSRSVHPSAHARYLIHVPSTIESFLAERGKKYRKEVERCYRLLENQGDWEVVEASTDGELSQAFDTLIQMQGQRWTEDDPSYRLGNDVITSFYQQLLDPKGQGMRARIFELRSEGEAIAVLYGVRFKNTFTMLRIASADGTWRRVSPGRLVVVETMRALLEEGVRHFDLGIGDYAFKRGFGAHRHPLVDLEVALRWKARPNVMLMQAKGWLRGRPRLLSAAKRARGLLKRQHR